MSNKFTSTFEYKLIYIFRINDEFHSGLLKIGEATLHTDKNYDQFAPNCRELNQAAKARINSYTSTAGIIYELLYTEIAVRSVTKNGKTKLMAFSDHDVHRVLLRSGIERHYFDTEHKQNEWFKVELSTAVSAIKAVKENRASLTASEVDEGFTPIDFRPEQKKAIRDTVAQFKKSDKMLWNAKMRFGKTLTALQVAKECGFKHTIIFTHRPVVSDGWYDDFKKIFYDTEYVFSSRTYGEQLEKLVDSDTPFVYFASLQDLRGSAAVGGKHDKNELVYLTSWDFVVIDEAHEGTLTPLGQAVLDEICKYAEKPPKILRLSGTPFNLVDKFEQGEIYTWDYVMEQRAKAEWDKTCFGDPNPYASLPKLSIYTYSLEKIITGYIDIDDSAFNFREFFRTWTGDIDKDFKPIPDGKEVGDFVHEDDVKSFLRLLYKADDESNYPYSTEEYRAYFRHSLWMVPGVKEAKALSKLLQSDSVFSQFKIVNVAGAGDDDEYSSNALNAVREAFGDNPDETYSITLSCGRLTTGVTVPEWTAVFMLAGSYSTSATSYLQTIFRVQSPANINGKCKERCCVFDFAPDRTLKMVAEAGQLSSRVGEVGNDKIKMGDFLNFCPVISVDGSSMADYDVDSMLQQLKRAQTDRVVRNGFDDKRLYNDNLLKLDDIELADFEALKKIVGASKQTKKQEDIDINNQGLTDEQYAELKRIENKPKRELTEEEKKRLEELKAARTNRDKAISILRGISIRIPLMVYGADVPFDKDITTENFTELIDDISWEEFMPKGVTKDMFAKFAKYYDKDIFVAAGRQVRNKAKSADELSPTERVKKIAEIFATFKNPDKETVLTPWRVVNMHMSDCLGGFDFYDEAHENVLDEPRFVDRGDVTAKTFANPQAKILEINSKTGLYPLYVVYSIYRARLNALGNSAADATELWKKTVEENIFVICKTPMAKAITRRTLLGYKQGKLHSHYFEDLIGKLKNKPEEFIRKVTSKEYWKQGSGVMKFDAVVGNPPYQLEANNDSITGNNTPKTNVFQHFQNAATSITSNVTSLIYPGIRWLHQSGKGLAQFGLNLINDTRLEKIIFYPNATDVFNNIDVPDGITMVTLNKNKKTSGFIYEYVTKYRHETTIRDNPGKELLILDPLQTDLVNKILKFVKDNNLKFLHESIFSRSLFNIESDFIEKHSNSAIPFTPDMSIDYDKQLKILTNDKSGPAGRTMWFVIDKDIITQNTEYISQWQVVVSSAHPGGQDNRSNMLSIIDNHSVFGRARIALKSFHTEIEAENFYKYMQCNFIKFTFLLSDESLTSLAKYVPDILDYSNSSRFVDLTQSIEEINAQLMKKFEFTDKEIDYINNAVRGKK